MLQGQATDRPVSGQNHLVSLVTLRGIAQLREVLFTRVTSNGEEVDHDKINTIPVGAPPDSCCLHLNLLKLGLISTIVLNGFTRCHNASFQSSQPTRFQFPRFLGFLSR